jgi:pimeloyl-ACP methyl ester carboxylesterase
MIEERQIDLSGRLRARITYHVAGDGPPVLLLHGWGASWYLWQETMTVLAAAGYRAIAPDHIGCGGSSKPLLLYSARDYGVYLDAFTDALGLDKFVLVGHSLGGLLAMAYAIRHRQRVQRLVVVGPAFNILRQLTPTRAHVLFWLAGLPLLGEIGLALMPARVLRAVLSRPWGGLYRPDRLPVEFLDRMAADLCEHATPLVCNTLFCLFLGALPGLRRFGDADVYARLGQVDMPTLVVWGEHDALLRPAAFADLAAHLPQATTCVLADAGHTPPVEAPQQFLRALMQFME